MTDWYKHYYEQLINKGDYDPVDETVITELCRMLVSEATHTDEGGQWIGSEEAMNSYGYVICDFLNREHLPIFAKITEDMKRELLQEVSPTQTQEGEGELQKTTEDY